MPWVWPLKKKERKKKEFSPWLRGNESDRCPWGCGFSPWPHSVHWRFGIALSYGVGCRYCSDLALQWLWCRLAPASPTGPLAWELPYATGADLKLKKKKRPEKKEACKRSAIKYVWFDLQATHFYGAEKLYTSLLRHMDFYVMPVVNVDGYDYTWKKVREGKENKTHALWGYRLQRLKYLWNPGSWHNGFIMKKI